MIANRGEIAIRIIDAAHALGVHTVAVYSDPDHSALHVRVSDEAYRLGPGPAEQSYLNIEAILEICRRSGADAVHPGYGFLAENHDFAQAVIDAGMAFVGPSPRSIRLMGDKIAAKQLVATTNVPVIPGYDGADQANSTLERAADRIGFPLMVKAAAGGGGRGMRLVDGPEALPDALDAARREALSAFGNGQLFLEKLLVGPRHIEVQVLGDTHGNLIHLFERDCSVQRRHQKVIEEAPSPAINSRQRESICEAGKRVAKAVDYVGAGTVEFLWVDGEFYFLEMNTRIQVEHGVSELITGRDIVQAQIDIAAGGELSWKQGDIAVNGHAIEARLYAEDPNHEFLPQFGRLQAFDLAPFQTGWRQRLSQWSTVESLYVDTGLRASDELTQFYDPMIAKLLVWNESRPAAIRALQKGIAGVEIEPIPTNRDFLMWVLSSSTFGQGAATVDFIGTEWASRNPNSVPDAILLGSIGFCLLPAERGSFAVAKSPEDSHTDILAREGPWSAVLGWRIGGQGIPLRLRISNELYDLEAWRTPDNTWRLTTADRQFDGVQFERINPLELVIRSGDGSYRVRAETSEGRSSVQQVIPGAHVPWYDVRLASPASLEAGDDVRGPGGDAAGVLTAPMPGTVVKVSVSEHDRVHAHQALMVLEAMKMEHVLESPQAGVVIAIHHHDGDLVRGGEPLIEIADDDGSKI